MFAATEKEMQLLGRAASEFARDVLIPERELHDRFPFGPFFEKIVDKAFELDFFHLILPEELEGTGMGIAALCRLLGELAREDASLAAIIFTTNVAHSILLAAGEVQMLRELSTDAKHAQEFLIAFPVFNNPSEIAPKVFAEQTSGKFKLQGQVDYLVLGSIARYGLIPAFIEKSPLYSLFLVDLQKPSAQVSDPVLSLGLHACPAVDVVFDGTNSRQVGNIGSGPAYFETGTAKLHLAAAAIAAGIMKGALQAALAYCKQRDQGGRKIIDWSELQMLLADMAMQIEVSDMLIAEGCRATETRAKGWQKRALAAAVHVQAAAAQVTTDGVQAMGGVGYMKDFGQEKRMRDAKHIQASLGLTPLKKLNILRH
ncbi:acyl-CoA dehydrogenase family protein [Thermodesulfobacteriota bacterium]